MSLVLENVCKSFGGVAAADQVRMTAPKGKVTGVIGPNGAGKTTIVNLVTGMLPLDKGAILLDGRDLAHLPAFAVGLHGVARTFQNIRLLADETTLDNVMVGFHRFQKSGLLADMLGLPSSRRETRETREKARALLREFGMERFADHPAGSLAYGHQRRVEMMRAIASDPQVLLLDEPVAGMNEVESDEMGNVFRALADKGVAVLVIEHHMRFITRICDGLYVLDRGRIIAEGAPKDVLREPEVISAYLGS
jgi:branched-chain amino acid transport system ATP-binding protein